MLSLYPQVFSPCHWIGTSLTTDTHDFYICMRNYRHISIHSYTLTAPTGGTISFVVYGTDEQYPTDPAGAVYTDVTNLLFGVAGLATQTVYESSANVSCVTMRYLWLEIAVDDPSTNNDGAVEFHTFVKT